MVSFDVPFPYVDAKGLGWPQLADATVPGAGGQKIGNDGERSHGAATAAAMTMATAAVRSRQHDSGRCQPQEDRSWTFWRPESRMGNNTATRITRTSSGREWRHRYYDSRRWVLSVQKVTQPRPSFREIFQTKEQPVVPIAKVGLVVTILTPPGPLTVKTTRPHLRCNRHNLTFARVLMSIVHGRLT